MYNGNKGGGSWNNGPKRSFGGDRGGDRGDRQMFAATCADCGKSTEVPFKPIAGRPVFCRDCFKKDENGGAPQKFGGGMDFGGDRRDSRGFEEKKLYKTTCDKCGVDTEVPFRPTGEKPVYCRPCFNKPEGTQNRFAAADNRHMAPSPRATDNSAELKSIHTKLDMIMKALNVAAPAPKAAPAPAAAPAPVIAKTEAKTKAPKKEKAAKAKPATKKKK